MGVPLIENRPVFHAAVMDLWLWICALDMLVKKLPKDSSELFTHLHDIHTRLVNSCTLDGWHYSTMPLAGQRPTFHCLVTFPYITRGCDDEVDGGLLNTTLS